MSDQRSRLVEGVDLLKPLDPATLSERMKSADMVAHLKKGTGKIVHDAHKVQNRGDRLSRIWWQGRTWVVTSFGIERRDGLYHIAADRLAEDQPQYDWMKHICRKGRHAKYDGEDFRTAYLVACALHQVPIHPDVIAGITGRKRAGAR